MTTITNAYFDEADDYDDSEELPADDLAADHYLSLQSDAAGRVSDNALSCLTPAEYLERRAIYQQQLLMVAIECGAQITVGLWQTAYRWRPQSPVGRAVMGHVSPGQVLPVGTPAAIGPNGKVVAVNTVYQHQRFGKSAALASGGAPVAAVSGGLGIGFPVRPSPWDEQLEKYGEHVVARARECLFKKEQPSYYDSGLINLFGGGDEAEKEEPDPAVKNTPAFQSLGTLLDQWDRAHDYAGARRAVIASLDWLAAEFEKRSARRHVLEGRCGPDLRRDTINALLALRLGVLEWGAAEGMDAATIQEIIDDRFSGAVFGATGRKVWAQG